MHGFKNHATSPITSLRTQGGTSLNSACCKLYANLCSFASGDPVPVCRCSSQVNTVLLQYRAVCCKWCIDAVSRMTTEQRFDPSKGCKIGRRLLLTKLTNTCPFAAPSTIYTSSIPPVVITAIALILFPPTLRECWTGVIPLNASQYVQTEFLLSEPALYPPHIY